MTHPEITVTCHLKLSLDGFSCSLACALLEARWRRVHTYWNCMTNAGAEDTLGTSV